MESWADIGVLGIMLVCGFVPFAITCKLMLTGKTGIALTVISILGAALTIALYSSTRPMGIDPMAAIIAGLLFLTPAVVGAGAGMLLGWLIYRRRNKIAADKRN